MANLVPVFYLFATGTSLISATLDCDQSCVLTNQFEVNVKVDGNEIDVSWQFNQSKLIYGFQTKIYKEDNSILYASPIIHVSQRFMKLEQELNGKSRICVAAFENSTEILEEKCEKIEINDLKVITGILAGTIFLIPCLVGIGYVIYKDYKVRHFEYYEKVNETTDIEKDNKQIIVIEVKRDPITGKKIVKHVNSNENKAFVMDEEVNQEKSEEADQVIAASSKEITTNKKTVSNVKNAKSEQNDLSKENSESFTESFDKNNDKVRKSDKDMDEDRDKPEIVKESEIATIKVTDEDVSGTSL